MSTRLSLAQRMDRMYWRAVNVVTPGLVNAHHRYVEALEAAVTPGVRWLDLGCGRRILPSFVRDTEAREAALVARAKLIVGVDLDLPSLRAQRSIARRMMADLARLPLASGSFDLVTANMVFEHLEDPAAVLREMRRVLAPGGVALIHTPNLLSPFTLAATLVPQPLIHAAVAVLERRPAEAVFPTWYRANTERRLAELAANTGLGVREIRLIESSAHTAWLGPAVLPELLMIRGARTACLRQLRTNLIASFERPEAAA